MAQSLSRNVIMGAVCAALVALGGCGDKAAPPGPVALPAAPAASAAVAGAPAAPAPSSAPAIPAFEVGKTEMVVVSSEGFGDSAPTAVNEAMRLAIMQVNGASIDMKQVNTQFGLDATTNQTAVTMRAAAFSDAVRTRSGGVIQNFKIINLAEPTQAGGKFKASIEASIAKFSAPADMKKVKLVVAPLRFDRASIPMGDRNVPAAEVGAQLRQRIQDALANTGRFAVLDREFNPAIQEELDMISDGQAPKGEVAKLGQAATADVIWIGKINGLAYNKSVRNLQTSDRQLVSYSGGWSISEKLVNVATRQVMASDSLRGSAPSTAPTTLGSGVNSGKVLGNMTDDLVNQVVASIISKTFPISVVSLEGGNVVLSQGGQSVVKGARYALMSMGAEMKDPQTGQSLGRVETPCCEVVVDRVTANLSYGHLENASAGSDKLSASALVVRERLKDGPVVAAAGAATGAGAAVVVAGGKPKKASAGKGSGGGDVTPVINKNDDKW